MPVRRTNVMAARPPTRATRPTARKAVRLRPPFVANPHFIRLRYKSHSLTKPFNGGRRRDGDRAGHHGAAGPGHPFHQPAELFHVLGARPVQHAAGGEEHQALHEGVIPDVEQPGGRRQRGHGRHAAGRTPQSHTQGQADQAHVLDAGVGEHALHVALLKGQRDPDQGREQAE